MKAHRISFAERTTADFSDQTATNDYFEQRRIVSNLLYRPISPSRVDAPMAEIVNPFLSKPIPTQRFEKTVHGTCRSVVSELPNVSQSFFDPSDCFESNNLGSLRNDLRNRKVPLFKSADDGQLALRRFEELVATLNEELSAVKRQLSVFKKKDEEQMSQLVGLAKTKSEAEGLKQQLKNSESFNEELKARLKDTMDCNTELSRTISQLKGRFTDLLVRLEVSDIQFTDHMDFTKVFESINSHLNFTKNEFQKSEVLKTENESLRFEIHKRSVELQSLLKENDMLRSRPVQVQERIVSVESAETRKEVADLRSCMQKLQRENSHLRSCPLVQERVVYQSLPCAQCPVKEQRIVQLKVELDQKDRTRNDQNTKEGKSENVVSISCQCNQLCSNCGSTPSTNIKVYDSNGSKIVSNVPLNIGRSDSERVQIEQGVFGKPTVVTHVIKPVVEDNKNSSQLSYEKRSVNCELGTQLVSNKPMYSYSQKEVLNTPWVREEGTALKERFVSSFNTTEIRSRTPSVYKINTVALPPSVGRSVSVDQSGESRQFPPYKPPTTTRDSFFQRNQTEWKEQKENNHVFVNDYRTTSASKSQIEQHRPSLFGSHDNRDTFGVTYDGRTFKTSTPASIGGKLHFNEYSY